MVNFQVNNGDLISFIEKCACNGVVLVTSTEKTRRNFFNYFYMDVKKHPPEDVEDEEEVPKGNIVVKAVDSEEKRMFIRHKLENVDVEVEGKFPITDVELLISILKSIPTTREIQYVLDKNVIEIKTVDEGTFYGYTLRQANLSEDIMISLQGSENGVADWDSYHTFDEEAHAPRITMKEGTSLYSCKIPFLKTELAKVVRTSVSLTKDQDLVFSIDKNNVIFKSGKKKDNIRNQMTFEKHIDNPIKVEDKKITNLHPIVEHLFDGVDFYCRSAGDGALKFYIISKSGNIELNFCSGSL